MSFPHENITKPSDLIPYITSPTSTSLTEFLAAFGFFSPFLAGSELAVEMLAEDFVK